MAEESSAGIVDQVKELLAQNEARIKTVQEQIADQWDAQRKAKWRGIAQRYPKMGPDEQQRIQQQMKSWAELTPQHVRRHGTEVELIAGDRRAAQLALGHVQVRGDDVD